jgi:hypothetical protein
MKLRYVCIFLLNQDTYQYLLTFFSFRLRGGYDVLNFPGAYISGR